MPSDFLDSLLVRVTANQGIHLTDLRDELVARGWHVNLYEDMSTRNAIEEMEQALMNGKAIIAAIGSQAKLNHAVLVRSIERTGPGAFDWVMTVNDPAIGGVIELDFQAWGHVTATKNDFIIVGP